MDKKEISKPLVIVLCLVILFSAVFIVRQSIRLDRMHLIATYEEAIDQKIDQYHGTLTGKNTDLISAWMTFDYINRIFALPADYMRTALAISDAGYPRMSISRYAKNHKLDQNEFLTEVQKTVANYFAANH